MTVEPATKDVCTCSQEPDEALLSRVEDILKSFKGEKSELIPILQSVQRKFGYLPEQAMSRVAAFVGEEESRVFGVATFYAQFKLVPTGRNLIKVCRGTGCH
ncbi:MAG TPA: NAD(P)H-dependent oxidoreductase subunit E, partial [Dehalococcoidia bacterium]|nr:NAD(P)H-dependent oxidoreductase subunit E [Dehalococcoidia bacterium]